MQDLRAKLIRLAHAKPELRPQLLPLLKQAATYKEFLAHHRLFYRLVTKEKVKRYVETYNEVERVTKIEFDDGEGFAVYFKADFTEAPMSLNFFHNASDQMLINFFDEEESKELWETILPFSTWSKMTDPQFKDATHKVLREGLAKKLNQELAYEARRSYRDGW